MISGARIAARIKATGLSQSELARRVGISQQAIGKLVSGTSRTSGYLPQIAAELGTTTAYLTEKTDDPSAGAIAMTPQDMAEQLDLVMIDQIDLAFGMGGAYLDLPFETQQLPMPRSLVQAITPTHHSQLVWARGRGDSMMPTVLDGDLILIDRTATSIDEQDAIWAVSFGEVGMIKRLRPRPDGTVVILSDNPIVPPDRATDGELYVVGRVIFIGRRT